RPDPRQPRRRSDLEVRGRTAVLHQPPPARSRGYPSPLHGGLGRRLGAGRNGALSPTPSRESVQASWGNAAQLGIALPRLGQLFPKSGEPFPNSGRTLPNPGKPSPTRDKLSPTRDGSSQLAWRLMAARFPESPLTPPASPRSPRTPSPCRTSLRPG